MIFFEPWRNGDFEGAHPSAGAHSEIFRLFNGSSLSAYWLPIKFERITEDESKIYKPSDFPWYGSDALVMRKKAYDSLSDIFIKNGEVLPLETGDNVMLFVFNSKVIDALDENRSMLKRYTHSQKIMYIEKHEFIESRLLGVDMFRLPRRASVLYVSEHFVERYKAAGLVGLRFEEVWRSNDCKTAECNANAVELNFDSEKNDGNTISDYLELAVELKHDSGKEDYDKAIEYSQNYIKLHPNEAGAYDTMGFAYLQTQRYNEAIECYKKAIGLNIPDLAGAYNNMGLAYFDKQDYDNAVACHKKAIELESDYAEAYFNMGNAYNEKLDYNNAIGCYKKAVELKPDLAAGYTNMGNAYDEKLDYGNAIVSYEKAIELESDNVMAYFNMGNVYNRKQDYDRAIEYYKKALGIAPDNAAIYRNIGVTYEDKQEYDKAIEYYKKAIELNDEGKDEIYGYIENLQNIGGL